MGKSADGSNQSAWGGMPAWGQPQAVPQGGRISYGEGMPAGGVVDPSQTYTPHTGNNKKGEAFGGGDAIAMQPYDPQTAINARPDLQGGGRAPQFATSMDYQKGKVTSIADQMAMTAAGQAPPTAKDNQTEAYVAALRKSFPDHKAWKTETPGGEDGQEIE